MAQAARRSAVDTGPSQAPARRTGPLPPRLSAMASSAAARLPFQDRRHLLHGVPAWDFRGTKYSEYVRDRGTCTRTRAWAPRRDFLDADRHLVLSIDLCFLPPAFRPAPVLHASHGLLCFRALISESWIFCVANPFTRQSLMLPAQPHPRHHDDSLHPPYHVQVLGTKEFQFKLLAVSCSFDFWESAAVFSSDTGQWTFLFEKKASPDRKIPVYGLTPTRVIAFFSECCYEDKYDVYELDGSLSTSFKLVLSELNSFVNGPFAILEISGEVFAIEYADYYEIIDEEEDEGFLWWRLEIFKLEGNVWNHEASIPETLDGIPMTSRQIWDLVDVAVIDDALCFAIGFQLPGYMDLPDPLNGIVETCIVVCQPHMDTWEVVDRVFQSTESRYMLFQPNLLKR